MIGGIPGVPARDLGESWPPLCSPLLTTNPPSPPPAGPCSPRAPAWNPGLAAASAPTLSSGQLGSAGHSTVCCMCAGGSSEGTSRGASSSTSCASPPPQAPALSPCTNNGKNNNSNNNQGSHSMSFMHDLVLLVSHILPMSTLRTGRLGKLSAVIQPGRDGVRIQTQTCWLQSL